jgi:hypothetical protein
MTFHVEEEENSDGMIALAAMVVNLVKVARVKVKALR